jgi:hypothetical protein
MPIRFFLFRWRLVTRLACQRLRKVFNPDGLFAEPSLRW